MVSLTFGIIISQLLVIALGQGLSTTSYCIDDFNNGTEWLHRKEYRVSCPDGGQIVGLTVNSGLGQCPKVGQNRNNCEGLTAYLIEDNLNCYWRQNCSVRIPNWPQIDIIVKTEEGMNCFGRTPQFLQLSDAICLQPLGGKPDIIDSSLFKEFPRDVRSCESPIFDKGIIRSHSFYPWDYEGTRVFSGMYYCFELYFKLQSKLVISVKDFDMWEDDSLMIIGKNSKRETQLTSTSIGKDFVYTNEGAMVILLHVVPSSIGGRGFVLCFANVDLSKSGVNACNEVVSKADITLIPSSDLTPATNSLSKVPVAPVSDSPQQETCKDCKKRCKGEPKKERKVCRKSCKPLCKKKRKSGGKRKKRNKGKKSKKAN